VETNWYVPHSFSVASQVTVVDPLNEEVRLKLKILRLMQLCPDKSEGQFHQGEARLAGKVSSIIN
jgi:hypothetical protein